MSVPIATSPGRSGFGPQLSLSYDSGAGNGPFGFGWSLSIPSITRKTDKGLPLYLDGTGPAGQDSDVFILSGAEDLVPVLRAAPNGGLIHENEIDGYRVRRYRPRIEGLFARIERWTEVATGDTHWRSISKDNILSIYGRDGDSRIADPTDPTGRVFTWLICETRDDKGNGVVYRYCKEDGRNIDLTLASERNRGDIKGIQRSVNRYLDRILYGNRTPLLVDGQRPRDLPPISDEDWLFEVVFDYGDHPGSAPTPKPTTDWAARLDAFSSYRAGFEVRTARRCERVLMFHHFEGEPGVGRNCLVRSTDFHYSDEVAPADPRHPIYTFLKSATQTGYRRQAAGYLARSLPPVDFSYTEARLQHQRLDVPAESLEHLPIGIDESLYRWVDLHGEGIPGILIELAGVWFYKPNLSPLTPGQLRFGPTERVAQRPNLTLQGGAQFMDLAGDGLPDLVSFDGPAPGFYEHDDGASWQPHRPFESRLNRPMQDPHLRWIDLDGDGRADLLISEDHAFIVHLFLGEAGFGAARRIVQTLDESKGPRLVFAEAVQTIFLADMNGDGLTDLVRIRNGDICYWPNLGYGRFGAQVKMDASPHFDEADQFDPKRLRLADIDGSGSTDLIYLHRDGVRIWFNQCGNSWSAMQALQVDFPTLAEPVHVHVTDLLGNGTACLVWSSPLPADANGRQMSYVQLIGPHKPHLLVASRNNLGAETLVSYAPSTYFYLRDKQAGQPWATRLPFPVHVVERVETRDHIGRNRFVTRYAYHHGHFDGEEREFRGFARVDQWDCADMAVLHAAGSSLDWANESPEFNLPAVRTSSWYHTGAWTGDGTLSQRLQREYYRPDGQSATEAAAFLLDDTVLPEGLGDDERREACRALKGSLLRQEVYAEDDSAKAAHPYTVLEQNLTLRCLQHRHGNRHAVFFTHAREALTFHHERNPADPRIQHALTLEVDDWGNVLRALAIGYGRCLAPSLPTAADNLEQTRARVTCTQSRYAVDATTGAAIDTPQAWRTPLPAEVSTWELTAVLPPLGGASSPFAPWSFWVERNFERIESTQPIPYEAEPDHLTPQRRLIEQLRTRYRSDDLTRLLPLGELQPRALPGESYQLAFTRSLIEQVYRRDGQALLPDPAAELTGTGASTGGYVTLDGDVDSWWQPSGRIHFHTDPAAAPQAELDEALTHFFQPRRYRDAFGQDTRVDLDCYHLLLAATRDALGNTVHVEVNDYRVLQPRLISDPNGNQTEVAFDVLGLVVGTAVMGKPGEKVGDSLFGFNSDPDEARLLAHLADPLADPHGLLQQATTRVVYDLHAFRRSGAAPVACTLARETHASDLKDEDRTRIQHSFSYSDGFGREVQKKIQAEPGWADPDDDFSTWLAPRWVGSGWTVFNNKGKPVRQYEPFFSIVQAPDGRCFSDHRFEFAAIHGVSPVLCYDPLDRVVATLHPNHSYEKVVFDPWQQTSHDVNDTVATFNLETGAATALDPAADPDVGGYFRRLPATDYRPTWYELRIDADLTQAAWPDVDDHGKPQPYNAQRRQTEQQAAFQAAAHAGTPSTTHLDALGRPFLTVARQRVVCPDHPLHRLPGQPDETYCTRTTLDIEGNPREVSDALGRVVMRYAYDLLGHRIHQHSMEAGARWMLNDVAGQAIRAWDSRQHRVRTEYDPLRRPLRSFVTQAEAEAEADAEPGEREWLTERIVYGEQHPDAATPNLRGRPCLHFDQAGVVHSEAFDFKGNLLSSGRRLALDYRHTVDWHSVDAALPPAATVAFDPNQLEQALLPLIDPQRHDSATTFDALNRPLTLRTQDQSLTRHRYNEANLLDGVAVNLQGELKDDQPVWTDFVTNIDYDAKGQRQRIVYGNGAYTDYRHDPLTFRLLHLLTRRNALDFPGDTPSPSPADRPTGQVQNLHYTYDPAGNITHIHDEAQQSLYFCGAVVEPHNDYVYDALYRLVQATGREHLGQGGAPIPHSYNDAGRSGAFAPIARACGPNEVNAMGRYVERYVYDPVGNFLQMQHARPNTAAGLTGWTRRYAYEETSLLDPTQVSNRLTRTTIGNAPPEVYAHDAHGNMLRMPHLPEMQWDYRDQLHLTRRQRVNNDDSDGIAHEGERTYYVYDASGQRVRKVCEKAAGLVEERIYLGGFEIYRKHGGPIGADS